MNARSTSGFTREQAATLDRYNGLCHLCERTRFVIAIDRRFQHAQTAYCEDCLALIQEALAASPEERGKRQRGVVP